MPPTCEAGRHRPRGRPPRDAEGMARGECRDCGAPLVRTLATRRWYASMLIGLPIPALGGP